MLTWCVKSGSFVFSRLLINISEWRLRENKDGKGEEEERFVKRQVLPEQLPLAFV